MVRKRCSLLSSSQNDISCHLEDFPASVLHIGGTGTWVCHSAAFDGNAVNRLNLDYPWDPRVNVRIAGILEDTGEGVSAVSERDLFHCSRCVPGCNGCLTKFPHLTHSAGIHATT